MRDQGWGMQNCSTFLLPIFQESYTYCAHASCRICGPRVRFLFVEDNAAEFKKKYHEDNTLCLPNTCFGRGKHLTIGHKFMSRCIWRAAIKSSTRKLTYVKDNISRETAQILALCLCEYWNLLITNTKQDCDYNILSGLRLIFYNYRYIQHTYYPIFIRLFPFTFRPFTHTHTHTHTHIHTQTGLLQACKRHDVIYSLGILETQTNLFFSLEQNFYTCENMKQILHVFTKWFRKNMLSFLCKMNV